MIITYCKNKIIKLSTKNCLWGGLKLTRTEKDSITCSVQVSRPFSRKQFSQVLEYSGVLLLKASHLLQVIVKASEF